MTCIPAVVMTVLYRQGDSTSWIRRTYGTARGRILTVRWTAVAIYGTVDSPSPDDHGQIMDAPTRIVRNALEIRLRLHIRSVEWERRRVQRPLQLFKDTRTRQHAAPHAEPCATNMVVMSGSANFIVNRSPPPI